LDCLREQQSGESVIRDSVSDGYADSIEAATEIYTEHGDFIRAVIRSKLNNQSQEDDLLQDFFLSLILKPVPYDVVNIRAYLYKALINDIRDAGRRSERHKSAILKYAENRKMSINKATPADALIEQEEGEIILDLIEKRLSKSESTAIALRYREEQDMAQVAEKMGVKTVSVSRYVCVGLKKVRQLFVATRKG
jgi:RNA polymerase sigma factor (sigma-70 family)